MVHPGQVDFLEELPEEMTFLQPYEGARYELTECTDFSQEDMVPSGVQDPFGRFVGRKVRCWLDSTNRDAIGKWMWRMWICLPWRTF
jgi:hypothetical protein